MVGTYILVAIPWGLGIPAAYAWAVVDGGGAVTLLRIHTAAWLLTAACFALCYSRVTPASRQPPTAALSSARAAAPSALSTSSLDNLPASGAATGLAKPLLQDGQPAA